MLYVYSLDIKDVVRGGYKIRYLKVVLNLKLQLNECYLHDVQ